ncbi:MAG: hypothetical protein AB1611_00460 [bacterium]
MTEVRGVNALSAIRATRATVGYRVGPRQAYEIKIDNYKIDIYFCP